MFEIHTIYGFSITRDEVTQELLIEELVLQPNLVGTYVTDAHQIGVGGRTPRMPCCDQRCEGCNWQRHKCRKMAQATASIWPQVARQTRTARNEVHALVERQQANVVDGKVLVSAAQLQNHQRRVIEHIQES